MWLQQDLHTFGQPFNDCAIPPYVFPVKIVRHYLEASSTEWCTTSQPNRLHSVTAKQI